LEGIRQFYVQVDKEVGVMLHILSFIWINLVGVY
jgi:hypothetical protein